MAMASPETCSVGKFAATMCQGSRTEAKQSKEEPEKKKNKSIDIVTLNELDKNIADYLNLQVHTKTLCPIVTEKWLIEDRLGRKMDGKERIYVKHRNYYGVGWRGSSKCQYPGHKQVIHKSKTTSSFSKMNILSTKQTEVLFSSPAMMFHLPVGSSWCCFIIYI